MVSFYDVRQHEIKAKPRRVCAGVWVAAGCGGLGRVGKLDQIRLAQFAQRFLLDLPNALTADAVMLGDLGQRLWLLPTKTESQDQHAPLALREVLEDCA